jgi:hypothetical protein
MKNRLWAVITGDVVESRKQSLAYADLRDAMNRSFQQTAKAFPRTLRTKLEIIRGDSCQGVLSRPDYALRVAIFLYASLRGGDQDNPHSPSIDTRFAIGIGPIETLPRTRASEGDGQAYRLSGPFLDKMKQEQRVRITTPWSEINEELAVECALLDVLVKKWTAKQAQAMKYAVLDWTQERIAAHLKISQPAVAKRLGVGENIAIQDFCHRFEFLLQSTHPTTNRGPSS